MKRFCGSVLTRCLSASAISLLVTAGLASAQATGILEGTVTVVSGSPLPDVQVAVVGTPRGARTDDAGRFRIPGIAPGSYQVRAQRIGYASMTRTVTIGAGQTATVSFSLRETALSLTLTVVAAPRRLTSWPILRLITRF